MKTISNIFKNNFKNSGKSQYRHSSKKSDGQEVFDFLKLTKLWPEILGNTLGKVTSPQKISGKTLIVLTSHPAFSQHLKMMEKKVLEKLFHHFPHLKSKVKKLAFNTNTEFFQKKEIKEETVLKKQSKQLHRFDPRYKELEGEAKKLLEQVTCEETRQSLTNIFIQLRQD